MRRIIAAVLFAGSTLFAQSTGSISGAITDPNGAAIAGAKIETKYEGKKKK